MTYYFSVVKIIIFLIGITMTKNKNSFLYSLLS